jgi:hypothetical protein
MGLSFEALCGGLSLFPSFFVQMGKEVYQLNLSEEGFKALAPQRVLFLVLFIYQFFFNGIDPESDSG